MRKLIISASVLVAAALPVATGATSGASATVSITKAGFVPSSVTIALGETVTWTNADSVDHQVVSQDAGYASPILKPGESSSFTFGATGRYAYQDALAKKLRGTITVEGGSQQTSSLTMTGSRATVVYGGSVTLSGMASSGRSGEEIVVLAQPYGQVSPAPLGSALSTAGGAWSFTVKPTLQTRYEARWKPATGAHVKSSAISVRVRPRVALRPTAMRGRLVTFFTKATAARSLAGRFLYFQRRNAFGQWVSLKKVVLGTTSTATFKARLPRGGSRLRAVLPAPQAGPGYAAGISPVRLITR